MTAPLPCGPTPDDARVARDGFDVDALYVALDRKRRGQRQRWRDVAAEVGVSPSTFSRMAHGANPDVPGLVRMLVWLDNTDLRPYIGDRCPVVGQPLPGPDSRIRRCVRFGPHDVHHMREVGP